MRFDIITIFPHIFDSFLNESLLARAQKKKLLKIEIHNLRDWANDNGGLRQAQGNFSARRKIDDKPFGGGLGMVMKVEPIFKAVKALKKQNSKVILFTPRGKKFTQKMAYEFSKLNQLIFICGRYEGVDERVATNIADYEISMGDYVTMGGEVFAMAVIETVSRLIPGVVGKVNFLAERRKKKGFIEYPQYTRPEIFREWKVPSVLLSGNHKKIGEWRQKHGKVIEN